VTSALHEKRSEVLHIEYITIEHAIHHIQPYNQLLMDCLVIYHSTPSACCLSMHAHVHELRGSAHSNNSGWYAFHDKRWETRTRDMFLPSIVLYCISPQIVRIRSVALADSHRKTPIAYVQHRTRSRLLTNEQQD
jgi:hypothetical protein